MASSLLAILKIILVAWSAVGLLTTAGLYVSGHIGAREHWSDRAARDPAVYQERMDYIARRESGDFGVKYAIVERQGNGTDNSTIPVVEMRGQCATDEDCNNGDCKLDDGYGNCDCHGPWATEDDDDPCNYPRKGRWGTFMLMCITSGGAYAYLSNGNAGYIVLAVFLILFPVIAVFLLYCFVFPGVIVFIGGLVFIIYSIIAAGVHAGVPSVDGWGHKTAPQKFF